MVTVDDNDADVSDTIYLCVCMYIQWETK